MTDAPSTSVPPVAPEPPLHDAMETCLRAVLAWQERPMSSASLRARVAGGREVWTTETLLEAADSLGYDVEAGEFDPLRPSLPPMPAIAQTRQGTALALLSTHEDGQVLVLEEGVPIQLGTPAELAEQKGLYARLKRLQSLEREILGKQV